MQGPLLEGTCVEKVIVKFLGNTHYTDSETFHNS